MLLSTFYGKMPWTTFISDVVPPQLQLWRVVSERMVIPLTGCWFSCGPLTHKELLLWFSNCSPFFLLFPLPLLYTCLLICFSSIIFLLHNIGFYIPDSFSLSLHCWLHCPSCCWTHLHLCKEWEKKQHPSVLFSWHRCKWQDMRLSGIRPGWRFSATELCLQFEVQKTPGTVSFNVVQWCNGME